MTHATAADFVGTWRLLDYSLIHDDGVVEKPWGTDVRGYLLYSAEGYMSGNLGPARRRQGVIERITPAARPRRNRRYIAYTGRFTVQARHHHPPRRSQPVSSLGRPRRSPLLQLRRRHPHAPHRPPQIRTPHHHRPTHLAARPLIAGLSSTIIPSGE